jgi:ArsR family metal-binding transcriptional regulator
LQSRHIGIYSRFNSTLPQGNPIVESRATATFDCHPYRHAKTCGKTGECSCSSFNAGLLE